VTLEEVSRHWAEVRRVIRDQSRQAEALVNSSTSQRIENGNQLVLGFASEFLSSKLEKEETRQVVEQALSSVLGKPCRVRGTVGAASFSPVMERTPDPVLPPAQAVESGANETSAHLERDLAATSDPVVQDLISRGGQVTDVQVLSEE
jgi:hypothetical protein